MVSFAPGAPIAHAYILSVASEPEREEDSLALAAAMLCEGEGARPCRQCRHCRKVFRGLHPDVSFIDPAGKAPRQEIRVDQIRALVADAYIMPTEAARKAYVLRRADTMNPSAQNAFLKLLEEPPRSAAFVLAAESTAPLLATVRSRCETLRRNVEPARPTEEALQDAQDYLDTVAEGGRIARLRWCQAHEQDDREAVLSMLQAALTLLAQKLGGGAALPRLSEAEALRQTARMEQALEYLRANVSVKHLMGLLSIPTDDLN